MKRDLYHRILCKKLEKKCFNNVFGQFCFRDRLKILAVKHFGEDVLGQKNVFEK